MRSIRRLGFGILNLTFWFCRIADRAGEGLCPLLKAGFLYEILGKSSNISSFSLIDPNSLLVPESDRCMWSEE